MMKTIILEQIDFEKVNALLEGFNKSTGFVTAILDLDGNVLSKSGWRQICTEFHRVNPETSKRCTISDTVLAGKIAAGEKYHFYKCLNGLVDVAVPIVIRGEHIANLFSGQFFFEEPDSNFFDKQAQKYGFDKSVYLKALGDVPVVSEEKVKTAMGFLLNMTQLISEITLQKMEQIELNEKLSKNNLLIDSIIDNSTALIYVTDREGKFKMVNKELENLFAKHKTEMIGKLRNDFMPQEIADQHRKNDLAVIQSKKSITIEEENLKSDGKHYYLTQKFPLFDKNGEVQGIGGISTDITDHKLAVEAIQKKEEHLRTIFSAMSEGFSIQEVICDNSGNPYDLRFIDANPAFERQTGLKNVDTLGHTLLELFPSSEHYWIELYGKVGLTGEPISFEAMFGPLNIYYHVNAFQTKPGQFGTMFTNINERKLAEEKLLKSEHNLAEAERIGKTGSWDYEVATDTAVWSENMFRIFEIDPEMPTELVFNYFVENLVHPDDREHILSVFTDALSGKKPYDLEYRTIKKDGSFINIHAIAETIRDESGKAIHMLGKVEDITERKHTEEALRKSELEFRTLAESMPQIVWITRADGWNIYFNQQWVDYTGLTLEESYGHGWNTPFHPDDQQRSRDAWQYAVNNNGIYSIEARLRRFDGEYHWWLVRGVPQLSESGEILKWFGTCTDIGEIKKAEEAMRQSEEYFKNIFEYSTVGKSITEIGGKIKTNKTFRQILGYTEDEFSDIKWQEITHPNDIEIDKEYIRSMISGEYSSRRWEKRYIHKDRHAVWVDLSTVLQRDNEGNPLYFITTIQDITARKQTEEALAKSQKLLIELTDNSISHIYALDPDGKFLLINKSLESVFGVPRETLIGRTREAFMPLSIAEVHRANDLLVMNTRQPMTIEEENIESEEKHTYISVKFPLLDSNGNLMGIGGVSTDITDRKHSEAVLHESEERFRKVFEEGSMGMNMSDLTDGHFISVNIAFCNMLGYKEEELKHLSFKDITHPDYVAQDLEAIKSLWEKKISIHKTEKRYLKKNGEEIWGERALTRLDSADGKSIYALAMINDITERKKAEEAIFRLKESLEQRVIERTAQLEEVNRELESFSYSVSHDLRAPLRHISGFADMLANDTNDQLSEKAQHYLSTINEAAQKMGILIDDLLRFSRTGRTEMRKTLLNMNQVVKDAIKQVEISTIDRIIEWKIANLPTAYGDYNLLLLVWINLVDNAVKYTRKREKAIIQIDCYKEKEEYIFSICDNGAGFDMKYAQKLFGVFHRLHSNTEFEGTGIGLANVRRIILRHGGRTWAEAEPDKGATFYFTLPG